MTKEQFDKLKEEIQAQSESLADFLVASHESNALSSSELIPGSYLYMKARKKEGLCYCDLQTVIMRYGCQCGGK